MQELMGHADIRTTMKYIHTNEQRKTDSAIKISETVLAEHSTEADTQLEQLEKINNWSISGQLKFLSKIDNRKNGIRKLPQQGAILKHQSK